MAKNDPLLATGERLNSSVTERRLPSQIPNSDGGFVFALDEMQRATRFLIIGTTGGTYYASEKALTKDNTDFIRNLAATRGEELVELLVDVSVNGRAARQDQTLYTLAVCATSPDLATRRAAFAAIPVVCRTATMLFKFIGYIEVNRGWGRGLRSAVAKWYTEPQLDKVAYQAIKYRSREGFTHKDLLRLSHAHTSDADRNALFKYIVGKPSDGIAVPRIVQGYELAQAATTPEQWASLVAEYKLPWEALPDAAMNSAEVWEALLPNTGLTALMRQLGRLSNLGVITSSKWSAVASQFTDADNVAKSKVHPLNVLTALMTYRQGHGFRGNNTWKVVPQIVDALDEAFILSFGNVEGSGTNVRVCVDTSGSMAWERLMGSPMTPREAAAAMAMVTVRTEDNYSICGFSDSLRDIVVTRRMGINEAIRVINAQPAVGTRIAAPMEHAVKNKLEVDTFVIYTDNEVNTGGHPYKALELYRQSSGRDAKLVVVGMTSTGFTVANPADGGMLDVVGFDSNAPTVIANFAAGRF